MKNLPLNLFVALAGGAGVALLCRAALDWVEYSSFSFSLLLK